MTIASIGELLWDEAAAGRTPGGAPANVAVYAARLGARAALVSRVGNDDQGAPLIDRVREHGVDVSCVGTDPDRATGTVTVAIDRDGNPSYTIHEPAAWDAVEATPRALGLVAGADAVCFGTLAQRHAASRDAIGSLLRAAPPSAHVICDLNLRPPFVYESVVEESLRLATIAKMNEAELGSVARMMRLEDDEGAALKRLLERFALRAIALTRAGRGSRLVTEDADVDQSAPGVAVADTVGAGDAYTAALAVGWCRGMPPRELAAFAAGVAARACQHPGAFPPPRD